MKNSAVVADPLGGRKKKPGEELSRRGVNTGRGPALGGRAGCQPAGLGRPGLLTAAAAGVPTFWAGVWQGPRGPGEPPELSPALLNQAGPECVSVNECARVCVCVHAHMCIPASACPSANKS